MEFGIQRIDARKTLAGDVEIILTASGAVIADLSKVLSEFDLRDGWAAKIAKKRNQRSLDANSYMWVLADKIAKEIKSTKEAVYRKAIRDVGVWEDRPIRNDAVPTSLERWERIGLGWFGEEVRESKLEGYKILRFYFGSSSYDTKEMSRLVDWIVEEAKELGIETATPEEIAKMKDLWR